MIREIKFGKLASRLSFLLAACVLVCSASHAQTYAITNAKVFPISGPPIDGATVVIHDGKITAVGKGAAIPSGAKVIDAKGLEVYPGFFNPITEIGINEIGAVNASVDTHEVGENNADINGAAGVNVESAHIAVTRVSGITHVNTVPGQGGRGDTGNLIGGQASLINLGGWTTEDMVVKREAGMVVNWPNLPGGGGRGFGGRGGAAAEGQSDARAAYDRRIAMLGDWLDSARHYDMAHEKANNANFRRDLKLEALGPVVRGEVPVLVFTDDPRAIEDAVKFFEKEKVKMVLATGEAASEKKDFLKQHNVNVILGPTLQLVRYEDDPYDVNLTLPHDLNAAGVKIAFASYTNEFARRLSQQAGVAVAFGLPHDEALKALTLYPAQMFGLDKELGTLEVGKMANVIVTSGDPLELTTEVKYLFIKGELTSLDNRHLDLYNKYKKRP